MQQSLSWGILGAGRIAGSFAHGVAASETGALTAIGSRAQSSADAFAAGHDVATAYGSYDDLLADASVDAVYIATPHPIHVRWAIRAAEAGKHILCEKPLTLNHAQAMAVFEAARANDVFCMEAFMYRCHPQIARAVQLIADGAVGRVEFIEASFAFNSDPNPDPASRLWAPSLGGGGILDLGCYPISGVRRLAGAAAGAVGALDPVDLSGAGRIGETGVDEFATAQLVFADGVVAHVLTGIRLTADNVIQVRGTGGSLTLADPWMPKASTTLLLQRKGAEPEHIDVPSDKNLYTLEADAVARSIEAREAPEMPWADSLGNMRTLDRWRAAIGLDYPDERPETAGQELTLAGRPVRPRIGPPMRYGSLPGIDKHVSRLVLGVDNQTSWPHAAAMFDDFVARGGTTFDTAYIYGGGRCEAILGTWLQRRGIREDVVVLGKGAHTPYDNPAAIAPQLTESLRRLRTDYVDVYMLHRDNPAIPAGEFIEALNAELRGGRIRTFGASNWSIGRVDEANAYAVSQGLVGFRALSNNFSLARMVEPVWTGCIAASDPASIAWLTEHQMPLMPWSSQARGFFVPGVASPGKRDDEELVHSWYSDENFARQARANELAQRKGVEPIVIALAYVLHQPFPTFTLIGPRAIAETRSSFAALDVRLNPDEVRWLAEGD